jgi:hypothetical protein
VAPAAVVEEDGDVVDVEVDVDDDVVVLTLVSNTLPEDECTAGDKSVFIPRQNQWCIIIVFLCVLVWCWSWVFGSVSSRKTAQKKIVLLLREGESPDSVKSSEHRSAEKM